MAGVNRKFNLDKIIHEPVRLQIMTYLAAGSKINVSFSELQEKLGLSSGNLSVQLRRLEEAGYISITKKFKNRRPLTCVSLTPGGVDALQEYIAGLEGIVRRFKDDFPRDGLERGS